MRFFFNDTATTEIYTLSLHDALPISSHSMLGCSGDARSAFPADHPDPLKTETAVPRRALLTINAAQQSDRKSTRLNSSHANISYAVFCLQKNTEHLAGRH